MNQPAITKTSKPCQKPQNKINNTINKDMALALALKGKGPTEIGKELGCDKSYISTILKPYKNAIQGYLAHKENPEDLWAFKEYIVLNSINDADIKKANLRDKIIAAGTARDKVNIERGKTGNTEFNMIFQVVDKPVKEIDNNNDNTVNITPDTTVK